MKPKTHFSQLSSYLGFAGLALLLALTVVCSRQPKDAASAAVVTQATFNNPDEAGQALLSAAQKSDAAELAKVVGTKAATFLSSGDALEDKAAMESFARKYNQMNRWVLMTDGSQVLHVGADNYEFPIPLVKDSSAKWQFDAVAGQEEVTARNIGRNELLAIDAVYALANAEEIYVQSPRNGNSDRQYTQTIISTPGKHDGLFWEVPAGEPASPLGRVNEFMKALSVVGPGEPQVFDGYSFRILSEQGDQAKGGAKDYVVNGKLTGFAIIATPVKYRETGIMTFVLNREGVMYQKDFGAQSGDAVSSIKSYNPDADWAYVE